MQKFILSFGFIFFGFVSFAQNKTAQGYDIQLTINGLSKGVCKFGYYYGENAFLLDSARVDSATAMVRFQGKTKLEEGMYFIAVPNQMPIDLVIDSDANFVISTDVKEIFDSLKIQGSKENEAYVLYQKKLNRYRKQMEQAEFNLNLLQRATRDPESFKPIRDNMAQERKILELFTEGFYKNYSNLLCIKFLKAASSPKIPENIKPIFNTNSPNPIYYKYAREHLWDNFDFTDKRMLRSKIINSKLTLHLQQLTFQQIDSLQNSIDWIVKKASVNAKIKAYVLMNIANRFDNNYAPGADRILVYVVDKYFPNEKDTSITDIATLTRLRYKADMNRPNLTGNIAKEMRLMRPDSSFLSLSSIASKYTMLYFYSPLCTHCQSKTPNVYEIFSKYKEKGVVCYAVNTDQEFDYWKNYIEEKKLDWFNVIDLQKAANTWERDYVAFNLPVIYLLDADKKILMKRVEPERLETVLKAIFSEEKK